MIGNGGAIETANQRVNIQHTAPLVTPTDLAQVPSARATSGSPLVLGDVANRVTKEHQPLIGDAVINDGRGLMLVVEKLPWANTLDVTHKVEAALDEMKPGLTGTGPWTRRSSGRRTSSTWRSTTSPTLCSSVVSSWC